MKDFFKYITVGEDDRDWGLYLNVAGKSKVDPHSSYPSPEHPTGYYFTWENGRVLTEFQLNYITEGAGILENKEGRFLVKPGTLIITRPGDWHRYKPLTNSGWVENYIGFNGLLAGHFLGVSSLISGQTLIHCSIREEIIDTYYKIFDLVLQEKPGFQQIASGLVVKLFGYIVAFQKQRQFTGKKIEQVIQQARFLIREHAETAIDFSRFAEENNIGYSYFRKMFKKYIGISPHQYHLDIKIMQARELILTSNKSIKEISFELGFQSIHYFSRLFKNKMDVNPSELRK